MDGNLNDLKTSLYNSAIAKGWDILDNGRLDSYKFSSDDYLEASTNRDQKPSTLTIRLLPSEKINSMNELSPTEKSQLEQTASKSSYVIVVNVSTLFEG